MKYTPEQNQWLKENIKENVGKADYCTEIAERFNAVFGFAIPPHTVHTKATRWRMIEKREELPLYSEKIDRHGYVVVKTRMKVTRGNSRWELKHRLLYEKANGKIPKGFVILFLDGNRLNTDIENLALITIAERVKLAQYGLLSKNREITLAGIAIVRHELATHDMLRKKMGVKEHKRFVNNESGKRCRQRKRDANNGVEKRGARKGRQENPFRGEKKVRRIDNGAVYASSAEASRSLGFTRQAVGVAIRGGWKCGGSYWEFADKEEA